MHVKKLAFIFISLLLIAPCAADVIVVKADGTGDYPTIQAAIDAPSTIAGDIIELQQGTYTGDGNRDIDFGGKAITVRSIDPRDPDIVDATIIDCEDIEGHRGFYFHSGEGARSVVAGLTIRRGNTSGYGGGIFCDGGSPTIKSCVITNCVGNRGGGIFCEFGSTPRIDNCIISLNTTNVSKGGGLYLESSSTVSNCIIANNFSDTHGGGIYGDNDLTLEHCTIANNSSDSDGGGIYCHYGNVIMRNCISWGNTADNDGPEIYLLGSDLSVRYSDIQGGSEAVGWKYDSTINWGEGNINIAPDFVHEPSGDYHLSDVSPCIQAGDPCYVPVPGVRDIDSELRVMNGRVEMGADEYPITTAFIEVSPTAFEFVVYSGQPNPESQTLQIRNIGVGTLNWEITEDCDWLEVSPSSGSSSGEVNEVILSVDISGLGGGEYICELIISDPCAINSPRTVDVNLVVEAPEMEVSGTQFEFSAIVGGANPDEQILGISNIGEGTLNWEISYDCNWLSVEPDSGSSTTETDDVNLSVDLSGLVFGRYSCALEISAPYAASSPQVVVVDLHIKPIDLNYDAEVYGYVHAEAHLGDQAVSDTDIKQDFSNNGKASVHANADAYSEWGCCSYPCYISQASDMLVGIDSINGIYGAELVSTFKGYGSWYFHDECAPDWGSGEGGGSGYGYTSLLGTIGIGIPGGYSIGMGGLRLKVDAEIFGDEPLAWYGWDWWLKIWDDDIDNPLALLDDSNMSAALDVLAGQVLNVEFYQEAEQDEQSGWPPLPGNGWPEDGLESTVVTNLHLCATADLDCDGGVDFVDYAILASQWCEPPGIPSADIIPAGGNGIVDINDLECLTENWLLGCPGEEPIAH